MSDKQKKARIELLTAKELLGMQFTKREWLVDGLMKQRQLALIYAPSGVGKSWFAWSLGCMVAGGGKDLHEYSNDVPRRVLILDGEMDLEDCAERVRVCAESVRSDIEVLGDNLTILSRQYQDLHSSFVDLDKADWQERTLDYCIKHEVDMVILDNLSTLMKVDDENSSSSLDGLTDFLLGLKRANIAGIVVHHANKANNSYRGSQKISVTFDLILALGKPKGAPVTGACFEVNFDKVRGQLDDMPYRLTLGDSGWITTEGDAQAKRALEALDTGEYGSYQELADGLGVRSKSTAHVWIQKAIQKGMATEVEVNAMFERAKNASAMSMDNPMF